MKIYFKPKLGAVRSLKKFAWLPTGVIGGKVWLEYYLSTQVFVFGQISKEYYWRETNRLMIQKSP